LIEPTRVQLSLAEGLIEEEVGPLWEEWMREVDHLLADRALVQIVHEALARRIPTRLLPSYPAGRSICHACVPAAFRGNFAGSFLRRKVINSRFQQTG
jgi:hypothetical protein